MDVNVAGDHPQPRSVMINAIVPGNPGGKPVQSTAVIKVDSDVADAPFIVSWRTGGIPDPLVPSP